MATEDSGLTDSAIGAAISAWSAARSSKEKQAAEMQLQDALSRRSVASTESGRDPFRQQLDQGRDASALDRMAGSRYTPVSRVGASSPYDANIPDFGGGFSYQEDPAIHDAAAKLRDDVLAGHSAPTMTDPANYGKTAALNLGGPSTSPSYGLPADDSGGAAGKGPQDASGGFTQGFGHGGFDPFGAAMAGYRLIRHAWDPNDPNKKKKKNQGNVGIPEGSI